MSLQETSLQEMWGAYENADFRRGAGSLFSDFPPADDGGMNEGVHSDSACISSDRRFIVTAVSKEVALRLSQEGLVQMNRTLQGRSVTAPPGI